MNMTAGAAAYSSHVVLVHEPSHTFYVKKYLVLQTFKNVNHLHLYKHAITNLCTNICNVWTANGVTYVYFRQKSNRKKTKYYSSSWIHMKADVQNIWLQFPLQAII
jgi:uncharacterized membrane protein